MRFSHLRPAWLGLAGGLVLGEVAGCRRRRSSTAHYNCHRQLRKGQHVFGGVQSSDLSFENARALARANIDLVYLDMEHTAMRLPELVAFRSVHDRSRDDRQTGQHPAQGRRHRPLPPYAEQGNLWITNRHWTSD